jgi:hypothetical protein
VKGDPDAPVRLCCFMRHHGAVCPDGLVMCCLCFGRFPVDQLHELPDGSKEDVCIQCARDEEKRMSQRG